MGIKIFYTGLTILLAVPVLTGSIAGLPVTALGALVTIVGVILIDLNK